MKITGPFLFGLVAFLVILALWFMQLPQVSFRLFIADLKETSEPAALQPFLNSEIDVFCILGEYENEKIRKHEVFDLRDDEIDRINKNNERLLNCLWAGECRNHILVLKKNQQQVDRVLSSILRVRHTKKLDKELVIGNVRCARSPLYIFHKEGSYSAQMNIIKPN